MTGKDLRDARLKNNWTQADAAKFLRVSQGYVSLLERDHRQLSNKLLKKALQVFDLPPTALPVCPTKETAARGKVTDYAHCLGALGYPDYSYLKGKADRNP